MEEKLFYRVYRSYEKLVQEKNIGQAKQERLMAYIRRVLMRDIDADLDIDYLVTLSRNTLVKLR